MSLPALIIPGTEENTIGIAVGYGRSKAIGKVVTDEETDKPVGANAFALANVFAFIVIRTCIVRLAK